MRTERAIRLRTQAVSRLSSLAGQAVFYGMSHADFSEKYAEIFDGLRKAKCPATVTAYLSGYSAHMREGWYARELAYCHRAPDGTLYTIHKGAIAAGIAQDADVIYKADRGCEIPTWESAHYWITASVRELSYGRPEKVY